MQSQDKYTRKDDGTRRAVYAHEGTYLGFCSEGVLAPPPGLDLSQFAGELKALGFKSNKRSKKDDTESTE